MSAEEVLSLDAESLSTYKSYADAGASDEDALKTHRIVLVHHGPKSGFPENLGEGGPKDILLLI